MDNSERDKKINETHDAVIRLVAIDEQRAERCHAHGAQISLLFKGYDQTNRNTISIKVVAVAATIIFSAVITAIVRAL